MSEPNQRYRFGPFELDLQKQLLWRNGDLVPLSPKLAETLVVLVEHEGDLVEKRNLFSRVWPDTAVEENSLTQNISALRKLLGSAEGGQQYIETVPRRGYRFVNWSSKTRKSESDAPPHARALEQFWPGWPFIVGLLSCAALSASGILLYRLASSHSPKRNVHYRGPVDTITTPVPVRKSIAVLRLKNLTSQSDSQWIGNALGEMFRMELSADGTLREIPGERVARMESELAVPDEGSLALDTLKKIHENLQADLLVIGSYAVLHGHGYRKIRVDVWVQDTSTGESLATDEVTGLEEDLFELASTASAHLRSRLGLADLSPETLTSAVSYIPKSPFAIKLYSQGLEALRRDRLLTARDDFAKAIQVDPTHPLPHAGLSDAWSQLGYDENARDEARLAFKYSSKLPLESRLFIEGAYWSLVHNWEKARIAYATLSEHYPDNVEYALKLADVENSAGAPREALRTLDGFQERNHNHDPRIDFTRAAAIRTTGDYKSAVELLDLAQQRAENLGAKHLTGESLVREAEALTILGNIPDAISRLDRAEAIFTQLNDQQALAGALLSRANTLRSQISYHERGDIYRRALAIFQQVGNDFEAARALNGLAGVQEDDGELELAFHTYQEALILRQRIRDLSGQGLVLNNIGTVFEVEGKLARSEEYYKRALDIFTGLHTLDGTALALGNIAEVDAQRGNLEQAYENYERALDLASKSGKVSMVATIKSGLGDIARLRGDLKSANDLYEQALTLSRQSKDNEETSITLNRLCEVHATQGEFSSSLCQESLSLSSSTGNLLGVAESRLALARVALSAGALGQAESIARDVAKTYQQQKNQDAHLAALTVLIESLPASAKEKDEVTHRAREIAGRTENPYLRIDASIAMNTTDSSRRSLVKQVREMENNEAEARKFGFYELELKARLAIAKLLFASGSQDAGHKSLASLATDARAKGFYVLAKSAEQTDVGR